ncbi:unnamed protein product [Rhizophagus irregularis]|nr:unnamed protein product [Rhizophagus irregularis]
MLLVCSHPKHDKYRNENSKICSLCRRKTDNNSNYTVLKEYEYNAPVSRKDNNDEILKIGTHAYALRNNILYTQEELKQLELDYQEIISQISIPHEISLIKSILETADQNLIGFFDELYAGTNPNNKSDKTNENNKKKLVCLCYFLASINNKYVNGLKADIGSYLQTAGTSASSIDTLNNLGFSVTRKTVDRQN